MTGQRRWWALAAIVLCLLTLGFDATILNVALPTLATTLHADTGGLQWIVDAYVLVFAGLLLPAGALGDRIGRKRLLVAGLALFGAASVGAAYVSSTGALIAARAVMGLGAAVLTPITLALLPVLFPPAERARAIAVATMGMGIGVPLGPIVGGWLLRQFWWGSVFLVNVPIAALALVAVLALVPESKDPSPRPADLPGGVLSTVGLVSLVYGVIEAPGRGWADATVLGALGLGVVVLALFVAWERRCAYPMIDLSLFRRPRFLGGTAAATLATFALFGLLFVLPQYLQAVLGYDAFGAGVRLLPLMAGLFVGASVTEKLVHRVGSTVPVASGLLVVAAGLSLGATTQVGAGYGFAATWLAVVGLGVGVALAPAMDAVLGELPPQRSGSGTALTMTLRQVGGALGVALLGSVLSAAYTHRLDVSGLPSPVASAARDSVSAAVAIAAGLGDAGLGEAGLAGRAQVAYVHAMAVVLLVCAGLALLGAVLTARGMPARPDPGPGTEESGHELARVA
jgi:EmrB/QacA subfamily drug resistance transporter